MALARVVSFSDVSKQRIEELRKQITEGEQPEDIPATEILVLHDPEAQKSSRSSSSRTRTITGVATGAGRDADR